MYRVSKTPFELEYEAFENRMKSQLDKVIDDPKAQEKLIQEMSGKSETQFKKPKYK